MTLVSGITSTNPLYLHFAYAELRDVALDGHASGASRRTALFTDQKFSPSLWSTLARESLSRLGHDYQTFLRRGAPAPADVPAPAVASKTSQPPGTPLLRKEIYKAPPQQSPISRVLDTFASDSDLSKAADAVASEVGTRFMETPIPELFRSTSSPPVAAAPPPTTVAAATPQPYLFSAYVSRAKAQCQSLVVGHSPSWCREVVGQWDAWWSRDRINKVTEKYLPSRDVDALIVEGGHYEETLYHRVAYANYPIVLAGLVCASLTEDRYGVVQRDIPRILEAFLSFLTALEEYQVEVTKLYIPPTPDEITQGDFKILREKERTRVEVAKATEAIGIIADGMFF